MRPAGLLAKMALIQQPASRLDSPREDVASDLLISGFLYQCASRDIFGVKDLRDLKILFDEFAHAEHANTFEEWELARQLANQGVAHGQRNMQPYEPGYEVAVLESGSARPQITYFVLPRQFPVVMPSSTKTDHPAPESATAQTELFAIDGPNGEKR